MNRLGHPRQGWNLFFLALPFMVVVILFRYVPLAGWILSFYEFHAGTPLFKNQFVGLKYFKLLLASRDFYRVLKNTAIFSFLNYLLLPLPMIFAILFNEIPFKKFRRIAQTLTTLPHFISWIIVYSLAFALFSNEGIVNRLLGLFGFPEQNLLTSSEAVYLFQTGILQWKTLGWSAIIYIAAITGIDQELYEAARVDGAGRFRCVWHITLPGLMPTFIVLALLAIANFVNSGLDQYFVFNNAFVAQNIEVLELYTYRVGMQVFDYSYATAVGIFKSVISIALLFITNYLAKKFRGESII
ncbi:MAG: ABC transporter permease subunit [Treponema sp.]|jgi:putative aldouronate transport system permease protein|nr:ABC transporter permease subunit [Treponema sp.]